MYRPHVDDVCWNSMCGRMAFMAMSQDVFRCSLCRFVGDSQNHRIVLVTGLCEQMDAANTKKKKKKNGIGT